MPKYFTCILVLICCPLILKLRCFCMVFLFGRKMIISVLLVLKLILFDLSHFDKNDRSWLMCLIFFKDLFEYERFVSSANRCTSPFLIALWRSLINIKNSKGPKTDPWGTPWIIKCGSEFVLFIDAN